MRTETIAGGCWNYVTGMEPGRWIRTLAATAGIGRALTSRGLVRPGGWPACPGCSAPRRCGFLASRC
jgi:hypothetical protein